MTYDFSKECVENGKNEEFVKSIDKNLFPILEKALINNPNFNQFFSEGNKESRASTILRNNSRTCREANIKVPLEKQFIIVSYLSLFNFVTEVSKKLKMNLGNAKA